ncbi:MAG: TIGR03617 family F420-dependent LLM class oxidoreductase [Chloroflexota bacterium]
MKLDAFFPPETKLSQIAHLAQGAETIGFDGIWLAETQHNPFLAATLALEHTNNIQVGTGIAVSFARSPAVMAHAAWDLAEFSRGRFILGLGTQIKAHIERRFGMSWPDSVVGKQREQIAAIRAFWHSWQTGARLNQRGDYYKITLSTPFFTPEKITTPKIPIFLAGVNPGLVRLAGECSDGFHVHPFHTPQYLKDITLPAIEVGAQKADRQRTDLEIVTNVFVVTSQKERERVREQIAFYASTPSYRRVLLHHGWGSVGEQLSGLAARQAWADMPALVDDTILETVAVVTEPNNLAQALLDRYGGLADRLTIYSPFISGERDEFWRILREGIFN